MCTLRSSNRYSKVNLNIAGWGYFLQTKIQTRKRFKSRSGINVFNLPEIFFISYFLACCYGSEVYGDEDIRSCAANTSIAGKNNENTGDPDRSKGQIGQYTNYKENLPDKDQSEPTREFQH